MLSYRILFTRRQQRRHQTTVGSHTMCTCCRRMLKCIHLTPSYFMPKTRVLGLSVGEDLVILACVVFTQCQRVTDGQTDRQTDGRTDIPTMASTGLAWLTPCKNVACAQTCDERCRCSLCINNTINKRSQQLIFSRSKLKEIKVTRLYKAQTEYTPLLLNEWPQHYFQNTVEVLRELAQERSLSNSSSML